MIKIGTKILSKSECQKRINEVTDTITILDFVNSNSAKLECSVCKQSWYGKPSNIYRAKRGCPVCVNQLIVVGYNDLWSTHPEVAKLLENPEDGYKYSFGSGKKCIFICPECGAKSNPNQICNVTKHGFVCHNCGDGISIPNKFMSNILMFFLGNNYEREKHFDWCHYILKGKDTFGVYDFYFMKDGKKYIVEMDGGFHSNDNNMTGKTAKEQKEIDSIKDRLAIEHDIKVIRIECESSELEYMKDKVVNSELSELFDFSQVDFNDIYSKCLKSLMLRAIELFNSGIKGTKEIADIIKVSYPTVISYLKRGNDSNLCNYDTNESWLYSFHKKMLKPVLCKTTNKRFDSASEASKEYGISSGSIAAVCRHENNYAKCKDGTKMVFEYI